MALVWVVHRSTPKEFHEIWDAVAHELVIQACWTMDFFRLLYGLRVGESLQLPDANS